jgi:hypothetical protein
MVTIGYNGMLFDMTVGGVYMTLISSNSFGFSIHENAQNGLDFDFASFSGKLKVMSVVDGEVSLKEEALFKY